MSAQDADFIIRNTTSIGDLMDLAENPNISNEDRNRALDVAQQLSQDLTTQKSIFLTGHTLRPNAPGTSKLPFSYAGQPNYGENE